MARFQPRNFRLKTFFPISIVTIVQTPAQATINAMIGVMMTTASASRQLARGLGRDSGASAKLANLTA
jgi:hypothetical protein